MFERIVVEEYLMEDDAVDYVKQLLEALQFMHEKNIVHLDLKVGRSVAILMLKKVKKPYYTRENGTLFSCRDLICSDVICRFCFGKSRKKCECSLLGFEYMTSRLLIRMLFRGKSEKIQVLRISPTDTSFE